MSHKIYFISGLGADHRLFNRQLQAGIPLTIIPWKIPFPKETIEQYAKRMTEEIPTSSEPLILGGVSFGGMMAIEMSKHIRTDKIILISSIKTANELPPHIRCWKYFPIYKIIGGIFFKKAGLLFRFIFGKMNKKEVHTFIAMTQDANPVFIKWAADKIVNWKNSEHPAPIVHIHGTRDLLFPIQFLKEPVIRIPTGTHIMVSTLSEKINPILLKEIGKDSL